MNTNSTPLAGPDCKTILDSMADGVLTVDRDLVITSLNPAAERMTGFHASEVVGKSCMEVLKFSLCSPGCWLQETLRTGRAYCGIEELIHNRWGEVVPVDVCTSPLKTSDGKIYGAVQSFRSCSSVESDRAIARRRFSCFGLIARDPVMVALLNSLNEIARSRTTVLILGEPGSGCSSIARVLHEKGQHPDGPFVQVNCADMDELQLERKLTGEDHGGVRGRSVFQEAIGGTLFLRGIDALSINMQKKLAYMLTAGGQQTDVAGTPLRIIASGYSGLKADAEQGRFNHDLYYHLDRTILRVPPLRERKDDVPLLIDHFISAMNRRTGKQVRSVSGAVMQGMLFYEWPGNVRELEHAIEHAFVMVKGSVIDIQHLPVVLSNIGVRGCGSTSEPTESILRDTERHAIEMVLKRNGWNRSAACRELGLSRTTLWRKMRKLGIQIQ